MFAPSRTQATSAAPPSVARSPSPRSHSRSLKLEEDLGAKLFDRLGAAFASPRPVALLFLTPARFWSRWSRRDRAWPTKNADLRGSVAVGVIPTIAPYLMPRYTAAFAKKYPDAKLRIVEETTSVLVEGLRNLSIDVAILALPLRHKDLELFPIRTEPLFAVLRRDHPRASAESLALKDLRGESFVMLRDGHCFRDLSIRTCTHARITPNIAFESDQFSSLLGMVAAGVGVSLVPEMAIDRNVGCRYVRLSDAQATRTIVAAVLRGRSFNRVQRAFVSGIRSRAAEAHRGKTSAANRSTRG